MSIIEIGGLNFSVEIDGVAEASDAFAAVSHNIRQQLLALGQASLKELHAASLRGDIGANPHLANMGKLAMRAAGLPASYFVVVRASKE